MTIRDPSSHAFRFAEDAIRAVATGALPGVAHALLFRIKNAATYHERGQLAAAQIRILEMQDMFLASLATFLHEGIDAAIAGDPAGAARDVKEAREAPDWQSMGLVDDGQIEESIGAQRIGTMISHASETELRELDGYAGGALGLAWADEKRNPLRGDVIGTALQKAIEKITDEPATQKILAREFGQAMAEAMPACYRDIIDGLKKRQVKPVDLALRPTDDHAGRRPPGGDGRTGLDDLRRAWEASWIGRTPPPEALRSWEASIRGRFTNIDPLPPGVDAGGAAALLDRLMRGVVAGLPDPLARSPVQAAGDVQLTELLRRLNLHAIERGDFETTQRQGVDSDFDVLNDLPGTRPGRLAGANRGFGDDELTGLMAINLIRAHRDELEAASRSRLDPLLIEVVSSLFDQILSDPRVPPQMARQIARLQLPVLRVALVDPRFFSSRRHPVRRFINRIASLACAFDAFDDGAGADLLARVSALVGEIVKGDFDQLDLYEAKLDALQRFVDDQTHAEMRESAVAPTLRDKEIEWRIQQRFAERLAAALEPIALPAFVRDFLCGIWAQAIVVASRADGEAADHPRQLRRVAAELIGSLQPKRSIEERNRFVTSLPALMRELTAGMTFAGASQVTREAFFGQLVALHMGSLKAPPSTDLDHNMRRRQIDAAARTPLPRVDANGALVEEAADAAPVPPLAVAAAAIAEPHFSTEEKQTLGLVSEAAVDWNSAVDRAPAEATAAGAPQVERPSVTDSGPDDALPTIDGGALPPVLEPPLDVASAVRASDDPRTQAELEPELTPGLGLRDHLQLGYSYELNLKGRWEKIRLTYMSPGRTLFLFSHGAKGRETVSMTTRTLSRLCEAGRLRAYETAYLIERSTERARRRLARAEPPRAAAA